MTTFATVETPSSQSPLLCWNRDDIERRCGFSGGRFTRVNNLLPFLIALVSTVAFYAALVPFHGTAFGDMFTQRGPTQYATVLFSCWALAILLLKWRKLVLQRKALTHVVVPQDPDFVLSSTTADQVMQRVFAAVDDPKHFTLFNRITIALSNLRNLGRVADVDDILRSQAAQDESSLETSYALVQGFVWAIPVLGFIGTVLGLSAAISAFTGVLGSASDMSAISGALRLVTAGLSTAFETTLVALVAALTIQLILTVLKKAEEEFLDECSEYCLRHVVGRLRLLPFEAEQPVL
ncbi:MAG: MotA/TolQ/ExbB proton channel family protein [Thermoguttaceae bacterium]|nr:MotA/TolQ/ExbB proton channel family protein [Thermoguttaceae bacterium]